MDRSRALDILDSLPPDRRSAAVGGLQASPEIQEACRVLEEDSEGRRLLESRRQLEIRGPFDREIGRILSDVPVAEGARQRLLARLAIPVSATASPALDA